MPIVLRADQMRAMEQAGMASGRVSGLDLMEKAAFCVCEEIIEQFGNREADQRRAAVLCGPGNNGGDGFAIAAALVHDGWQVSLWATGSPEAMSAEAAAMRSRWSALGATSNLAEFTRDSCAAGTVVVDALFGTGLHRPVGGLALDALIAGSGIGPVVAVDILSGVNADTGEFMSTGSWGGAPAQLTVTFQCAKPGHFLREGGGLAGKLVVKSIGLERELDQFDQGEAVCRRLVASDLPSKQLMKRDALAHKYDYGHLLVLSGGRGKGGAARLAARAGLRVGAGLVTIGVESAGLAEHASQLNAIMLQTVDDACALESLLEDPRVNSVCAGPGLGTGQLTRRMIARLLESGRPLVLDADALSSFSESPEDLFGRITADVVMTPHGGEFRRLFPDLYERAFVRTVESKLDVAQAAARRSNAVVLLKGHDTVVAAPDGRVFLIAATGDDSVPWLATAGSGDVLAGLIAGLMARGFDSCTAACSGALLHHAAARSFGPGLIAEDLPEAIPAVLAGLEVELPTAGS